MDAYGARIGALLAGTIGTFSLFWQEYYLACCLLDAYAKVSYMYIF